MTVRELEGRWVGPSSLGPGTRYELELGGAGERFTLLAAAWAFSAVRIPGTDRPQVQLLGKRLIEGRWRVDAGALMLESRRLTDVPAELRGAPHGPPIQRDHAQTLRAEIVDPPAAMLKLRVNGADVSLTRV